jgi:hypothetical protein
MRLTGKGNNFCLIMGGGERLQGWAMRLRNRSPMPAGCLGAITKPDERPRSAGVLSRSAIC